MDLCFRINRIHAIVLDRLLRSGNRNERYAKISFRWNPTVARSVVGLADAWSASRRVLRRKSSGGKICLAANHWNRTKWENPRVRGNPASMQVDRDGCALGSLLPVAAPSLAVAASSTAPVRRKHDPVVALDRGRRPGRSRPSAAASAGSRSAGRPRREGAAPPARRAAREADGKTESPGNGAATA